MAQPESPRHSTDLPPMSTAAATPSIPALPTNTVGLPALTQAPAGSWFPVLAGSLILAMPLVICFALRVDPVVEDPDVWWHLRTADWIIAQHQVPATDSFSRTAAGQPYPAYSWLAELALDGCWRAAGLRGLVLFTGVLSLAVIVALFALCYQIQRSVPLVGIFTSVGVIGMMQLFSPRPWLLTMAFFLVELHLLLSAARKRQARRLLGLVPLFAVWANVHIQFTLGLALLGLAVIEPVVAQALPRRMVDRESRRISWRWRLGVFALCVAATLLNPYHVRLYAVAVELLGQKELWNLIDELQAMSFRAPTHWAVLGTALAAVAAWSARGRMRVLLMLAFPLALYLGFRSQRDQWLVMVVGIAMLAHASQGLPLIQHDLSRRRCLAIGGILVLLTVGLFVTLSPARLSARVEKEFPVQAVAHIQKHGYAGPLFNPFDWGGYLVYACPELPVCVDGRTIVYGEKHIVRHARTLAGKKGWCDDPDLAAARLVLIAAKGGLASLLRQGPAFKLEYEDDLAAVFVRK